MRRLHRIIAFMPSDRGSRWKRPVIPLYLTGLICLSLVAAQTRAAGARVEVSSQGGQVQIAAEIDTTVGRELAWEVLTDYGRWPEFIPDMTLSRIVSRRGEPLRVEQRGSVPWLPNFPMVVLAEVEEIPMRLIRFRRIAGNLRALTGEWRIEGESAVRLLYRSTVEPGFPLPPQVSAELFRRDAQTRLEAMAREMARRDATASR